MTTLVLVLPMIFGQMTIKNLTYRFLFVMYGTVHWLEDGKRKNSGIFCKLFQAEKKQVRTYVVNLRPTWLKLDLKNPF